MDCLTALNIRNPSSSLGRGVAMTFTSGNNNQAAIISNYLGSSNSDLRFQTANNNVVNEIEKGCGRDFKL